MKKFLMFLVALFAFTCVSAQEENLLGDDSTGGTVAEESQVYDEPVTNEDKMEENEGKEENVAPAETKPAKGESKFNKFMNRKGKKALAGVKAGPEIYHNEFGGFGGFHFDAFLEYNFIKNFGLQAELNFGGGYYGTFTLPIIAQGNFPITDMFWLNAGAGIYFSAGFLGYFDMGLIIKTALEINTKVGVFIADIRYSPSLYDSAIYWDGYHGTFAILVGYAVPLPF